MFVFVFFFCSLGCFAAGLKKKGGRLLRRK